MIFDSVTRNCATKCDYSFTQHEIGFERRMNEWTGGMRGMRSCFDAACNNDVLICINCVSQLVYFWPEGATIFGIIFIVPVEYVY